MPWRLVLFILIFAVFLVFITFNLENRCDINFGFYKFEAVPVFLTVFVSFVLGLFCAFPLVMQLKKTRKNKLIKSIQSKPDISPLDVPADDKIKQDAALAKKRFFAKRRGSSAT
jgi:uncharacterized integral membrane protein